MWEGRYVVAGVAVIALVGVAVFAGGGQDEIHPPRVAVIVLDGADWQPVNQLLADDDLSEVRRMMRSGVYGNLSTPRAFSPVTWTKIATGHRAEDLNIKGWTVQEDTGRRLVQSTDIRHQRVWEYLGDAGVSVGVIQWLLTWPVTQVNGYMVAGPLAGDGTLISPEYAFGASPGFGAMDEWAVARTVLKQPPRDVRFIAAGFKRLDAVQHYLWRFLVPERFEPLSDVDAAANRERIYAEYRHLDDILSRFNQSWNVIVIGDSGFEAEMAEYGTAAPTYEMNLEPLLRAIGYHNPTEGYEIEWCNVLYPRNNVIDPGTYRFRLCVASTAVNVSQALERLRTVTYRDGGRFLFNLSFHPGDRSIRGNIRFDREAVVNRTVRREPVSQPTTAGATTFIDVALGLTLPSGEPFRLWIGPEKTGDHPPGTDSIFLARGPAFRDAGRLPEETIRARDITPTILYMYDLPIPREIDGRAVTGLFTEAFNARRDITYVNASTRRDTAGYAARVNRSRTETLKERLRSLGYLG